MAERGRLGPDGSCPALLSNVVAGARPDCDG